MIINVRYPGFSADMDAEIERIVGAESVSSGMYIPTGERDLQFDLAPGKVGDTLDKLAAHGVTAERSKPTEVR